MTEPTDDEIAALRSEFGITSNGRGIKEFTQVRDFARAVLAKWRAQHAVVGEPVAWLHDCAALLTNDVELWINACPHCRKPRTLPQPTQAQPTQAQPTQAQAGAVPLTDEQIEALPLWKRFVGLWPETRREIVRTIERHHGIKGGQHGAE